MWWMSGSKFEELLEPILRWETGGDLKDGGWNHDPSDPGGPTQFGIASNKHPQLARAIKSKTLTRDVAEAYYKAEFYDRIVGIDKLPDPVAFALLDAKIHGGLDTVVNELQMCLVLDDGFDITVDGDYGPVTAARAARMSHKAINSFISRLSNPVLAALLATRVKTEQLRKGLPLKDYTKAFQNRLNYRMKVAKSLW